MLAMEIDVATVALVAVLTAKDVSTIPLTAHSLMLEATGQESDE